MKLQSIGYAAFAATFAGLALSTPVLAADEQLSRQTGAGSVLPAVSREFYLQFAGEKAGQVRDDNGPGLKLIWCPPGMFTMEAIVQGMDEPAPLMEKPKIELPDNDDYVIEDESPPEAPVVRPRRVEQITRVKTFLRRGYWLGKSAAIVGLQSAQQVGRKKPNPWGLCDMHGNVWEWCRDCFRENPPGGLDPEVTTDGPRKVFRGGSWNDSASNCRSASRKRNLPSWLGSNIGFRVALSVVR